MASGTELILLGFLHNPWYAQAARSGAVTSVASAYTVIPFDTILADYGGNFTTGAGAGYTIPTTGRWLIDGRVYWNSTASCRATIGLMVNSVVVIQGLDYTTSTTTSPILRTVSETLVLVAGDFVQMAYWINVAGVTLVTSAAFTTMTAQFLSPL